MRLPGRFQSQLGESTCKNPPLTANRPCCCHCRCLAMARPSSPTPQTNEAAFKISHDPPNYTAFYFIISRHRILLIHLCEREKTQNKTWPALVIRCDSAATPELPRTHSARKRGTICVRGNWQAQNKSALTVVLGAQVSQIP